MTTDGTSSVNPGTHRPAISRRLRFEVLRRDRHTCRYCGATAPGVRLHVDHVIPVSLGGSDDPSNLVAACADCNGGKGSTSPDEHIIAEVSDLTLRMAEALKAVAEERRQAMAEEESALHQFYSGWMRLYGENGEAYMPSDWDASVSRFMLRGLNVDDLLYMAMQPMGRTYGNRVWRYFCGCCWTEITRRDDAARRRVEQATMAGTEAP